MKFSIDGMARQLKVVGAGLVFAATALTAMAQDFPTRPVEMTVLFPAGSSADLVARALAEAMGRQLGQQVVVVNRPGAGGAIGYRHVAGQRPNGYSIVFNSNSISTAYHSGTMPFGYTAFDAVARVTLELPVLAVQAAAPWRNLNEMVTHGRQRPGAIRVGNSGIGSHTHMSAVAFFDEANVQVTHVPFAGAQVVPNLLGGHFEAVVSLPGALAAHVRGGSLRVLGTLAATREPVFRDVPTSVEQGFRFTAELWRGIAVPRGTPQPVITRLEDAIRGAVASPEFKAQGELLGFVPAFQPASEFSRTISAEDVLIRGVMQRLGLATTQQPPGRPQ